MQDSPWENRQCTGKGIIMAAADIGIDLGTSSILVYTKGKGIVLKEPSVVAYDKDADKVKAIGEEARQMIGRTPGNIMAIRPLRQGVISDYTITCAPLESIVVVKTRSCKRRSAGPSRRPASCRSHRGSCASRCRRPPCSRCNPVPGWLPGFRRSGSCSPG